jgi:hypothetical protein
MRAVSGARRSTAVWKRLCLACIERTVEKVSGVSRVGAKSTHAWRSAARIGLHLSVV